MHRRHLLVEGANFHVFGHPFDELRIGYFTGFLQQIPVESSATGFRRYLKKFGLLLQTTFGGCEFIDSGAETTFHLRHVATEYHLGMVHKGNVIADFFDRRHVVG